MRKIAAAFILIIPCLSPVFAGIWFSPYPASFGIDLADTATYCGELPTNNPGSVVHDKTPGYNDNTLVALLGVTETGSESTVTVSFPSDDSKWVYTSASQPEAKREYEIYLIERRRYRYWYQYEDLNPSKDSIYRTTDLTESVVKLSLDSSGGSSTKVFTFPATNGSIWKEDVGSDWAGYGQDGALIGCWLDIVIALPAIADQAENVVTSPADDYSSELDVEVTGAVGGNYHLEFTGFYGDDPGYRGGSVLFNVVPDTVNANSIVLDDIDNGDYIKIGDYSYTTTHDQSKADNEANNEYYIFASASESPITPNNSGFVLRLQGTDINSTNKRITVPYTITLVTDSHDIESARSVEFDGTDSLNGSTLTKGLISLGRHESQIGDDGTLHTYYDNGTIQFKLADTVDQDYINDLIAGVYESKVYFHVVSKY